jgi:DNA-directed RNA polymerase specialized sigma24 family protein
VPGASCQTVVKHEALAVRRQRGEAVPVEHVDLDSHTAEVRPVDDLLAGRERVTRSAEALRRLKPDEAKALMLKAQGLSYTEIGERLSWTTRRSIGPLRKAARGS